jgi:hypothetical protein
LSLLTVQISERTARAVVKQGHRKIRANIYERQRSLLPHPATATLATPATTAVVIAASLETCGAIVLCVFVEWGGLGELKSPTALMNRKVARAT